MFKRLSFGFVALAGIIAAAIVAAPDSRAQRDLGMDAASVDPAQAQAELERATREGQRALKRADRLAREAEAATEAADKTAREAASLAAQIQVAEADILAAQARYSLTQADRAALSRRLASRQEPLVRLTGALQITARRPLALSALQPGSLKELVYVRAVLDSAVPEIRRRTSALRGELEAGRRLERDAAQALTNLAAGEQALRDRRAQLAALETRQRFASREARSNAAREAERALALAEEARDLDGLIDIIDEAAGLRRELAALPGPIMRPRDLAAGTASETGAADVNVAAPRPSSSPASTRLNSFQLPVQGRTIAGFGELRESGLRSTGIELAPAPGAQVVAPAAGRVAFAGPYRGFGRIVIIEHSGGWTSLVTGLDRIEAQVGDEIIAGGPLGVAGRGNPAITIELRRSGVPVNPLNHIN